jgi:hypothetical protein
LLDLSMVLRHGRRPEDAVAAADAARTLYERKGNLVSADEARSFVGRVEATVQGQASDTEPAPTFLT